MPFVEELSHPFVLGPMIAKIIGDRTESIRKSYRGEVDPTPSMAS